MTGQASAGGHARHAFRPPGAAVRIPPLKDSQGNDVTGRWPLRSFLELGALPSAVPCARLHARQLLWEWGLHTALGDSAELLVAEIVTNAIQVSAGGRGQRPGTVVAAGRPGTAPDPGLGRQPAAPGARD